MKKTIMDVIVVGGGAAGLMAAITAARTGAKVLILEHNDTTGKKILATGNGRCNFTNTEQGAQYYRSDSPAFVLPSLQQFSVNDTISFFKDLGVMTTVKNGYCYPRTMQASTIRNALLKEAKRLHICIQEGIGIRKIYQENNLFVFDTKSGLFFGRKCILSTGGKADPKSGSDGSGYIYAKQLGHHMTVTVPSLVPLVSNASWLKDVKGVRQDAKVNLYIDDQFIFEDHGEVQFTEYGISGIPVFQSSRYAAKALADMKKVHISIDFMHDMTEQELTDWFLTQIKHYKETGTVRDILTGIVNQKIANVLALQLPFNNQLFKSLSGKQIEILVKQSIGLLKETTISITDNKTFMQAQVTAGGVKTEEINAETMESTVISGLYFAGEIIDVDGMCGGYNLQWAWSSGYVAGKNASIS